MWTRFSAIDERTIVLVLLVLATLLPIRQLHAQTPSPNETTRPTRAELVVLIDIDADQKKVFAVEQLLAEDLVRKLGEEGFSFSLITFGSGGPSEIKSAAGTHEALNAIRDLSLEVALKRNAAAPKLYEAMTISEAVFSPDASQRAVLVISGGWDDLDGKRFEQVRSTLHTQQIICHVAMVSWHPLYGTKGIQVRGFYLHNLASKTHGKYVELGKNQKKVQPAVEKLAERILQEGETRVQ